MKRVILMQGLPGSGKSTFITDNWASYNPTVCSADGYFNHYGIKWSPRELPKAHAHSLTLFAMALGRGDSLIFVDNTNTQYWETGPYREMALAMRYEFVIADLFDAGLSDEALAERNIHNVPVEAIARMRDRYESLSVWTGDDILHRYHPDGGRYAPDYDQAEHRAEMGHGFIGKDGGPVN